MISIVIPHFDDAEILERNLPKILEFLKKSGLESEVIVVDDHSPVEVVDKLKDLEKKFEVKIIYRSENEGFGATVDVGIKMARGEIVFVLKVDVLPERADYFKLMLDHFKDPKVFSVSAALKSVEDGKTEIRGQGIIVFSRGFFLHFRTKEDYVEWLKTTKVGKLFGASGDGGSSTEIGESITAWADGGAQALRKESYLKIGGFDRLYLPFYWEDADLGYRAWKAGYELHFEPKAILKHDFHEGSIRKHYSKKFLHILNLRNQFIFVWKNSDCKHWWLYQLWRGVNELVAIKNLDMDWFRAYWQMILVMPGIILARYRQNGVTKLSDDQALGIFRSI